jgi:predicted phage terminase large subunit-like protein
MIDTATQIAAVRKRRAELSLYEFVRQAWHIVEPGTPFVDGPHIRAMCLHLEAVTRRQIRNLLINIPPRCMKSLLVSVFWPCWIWTTRPETRFMFASYKIELSARDSMKCRRIIESGWYQSNWRLQVQLTDDSNTKTKFENERTGHRVAVQVGGGTGEGADFLVVDDPNRISDAFSPVALLNSVNWFIEEWSTRLNDMTTGCKVVVMQRISEADLSAHIIKGGVADGSWQHLMLPMEFDPSRKSSTSIWTDWRQTEGELLWPQRIDIGSLSALKKELGRYGVAGQLQQTPTPRGGGMFERHWFKIVDAAPAVGQTVRYWDRAGTEGAGDMTVGLKMRRSGSGMYHVLDVVRLQGSPMQVEEAIKRTATQDGKEVVICLEQDPGQAGKADVGYLIRQLSGWIVKAIPVTKNKETRAGPVASQAEAGNIILVKGAWNDPFLEVICWFPRGANDDDVDTLSGAFNYLSAASKVLFAV